MKILVLSAAMLVLFLPSISVNATYYIDFASGSDSNAGTSKAEPWKRAPGMIGFVGTYTHHSGDHFIFKGGVTWDSTIAPWNNSNSGSAGNTDYYGVDRTWYTGSAWSNPIFDGGSNPSITTTSYGYFIFTGSHIRMDSLQVQNIGVSGTNQGNYALVFEGSNLTVENMVLPVMSRIAIYYRPANGTFSNITFSGNNISACSWGIAISTAAPNTVISGVYIHDNIFHDFHPQIASGAHADGIFTYGSGLTTDATQYATNEYIYNNSFYGDFSRSDSSAAGMTAFMYFSQTGGPVYIYNNHGTDSEATSGYVFEFNYMDIYPNRKDYLYNNSFSMDTAAGGWEGFIAGGYGSTGPAPSITVENNIYTGGESAYYTSDPKTSAGLVSNYNDFYGWALNQFANLKGTIGSVTYGTFKSVGYEARGLNASPQFVSSTDLQLLPQSPAISAGIDLSPVFSTDAEGKPRPRSGPWSMGAY